MISGRIPLAILNHVYEEIPVPIGVYVQFNSLFIPNQLNVLDVYQPAVYGYIRYTPPTVGDKYNGWEIDISRTGRKGCWVLGARISNHTIDDRLIGRPLDRDSMISLDDPRLRFRPHYQNILNPNLPETRQVFINKYLRDFQLIDYIKMRRRWSIRRETGLKAHRWRHEKNRRWRRLDHRRNKRREEREERNTRRDDRRSSQYERRERGEEVTSVVSEDEVDTPPDSPPVQRLRSPRIVKRRGLRWEKYEGYLRTKELRTESSISSRELDEVEEGGEGTEGGEMEMDASNNDEVDKLGGEGIEVKGGEAEGEEWGEREILEENRPELNDAVRGGGRNKTVEEYVEIRGIPVASSLSP